MRRLIRTACLATVMAVFSCTPDRLPARPKIVRPEPITDDLFVFKRNRDPPKDKLLKKVASEAGLKPGEIKKLSSMHKNIFTVRVGDVIKIWPTEKPIKVMSITPKEIRFSEGTRLSCGENYHYIDVKLHVLVSKMKPDGSVTMVVAR